MRPALRALLFSGAAFNPLDLFAGGYDGFYFDFSKTDRTFQESTGPTPADDATEPVGLALSERLWGGKTFAEVMAAQSPVLNEDFSSYADTAAMLAVWSNHFPARGTPSLASGKSKLTNDGTGNFFLEKTVPTVAGKRYWLECDSISTGTARAYLSAGANSGSGGLGTRLASAAGAAVLSLSFVASGSTTYIDTAAVGAGGSAANYAEFDNVSVKEIPGNHAVQSLATGRRPTRQAGGILRWDGVDDYLLTSLLPSAAMSLFFKGKVTSGSKVVFGSRTGASDDIELYTDASGYLAANAAAAAAAGSTDIRGVSGIYGLTVDANYLRVWSGATKAAEAVASGSINTTVPIVIGGRNTSGTVTLPADADVFKAFAINRALTPSEIASLVNAWS